MSNNSISTGFNNIQQTLAIHKEIAQGAIMPSIDGHTPQVVSFGSLMKQKLQEINQDQLTSSMLTQAVDSGRSDDLVGAMVASQKASLSFSALMQVRNRLVQAFDDVMKMPI